jgi:nitrite reductase/ring-hydroxylating ferredoxin subunit
MSWLPLIDPAELPVGTGREVVANGRIFAVYNVAGEFHVLDGICPHAGGPLGKGTLRGDIVTCPWHGWQFNIPTGQHTLTPRICAHRYNSRISDGKVEAEIESL